MEAAAAAVELKAGASWADDEVDEGASSFSPRSIVSAAAPIEQKKTLALVAFFQSAHRGKSPFFALFFRSGAQKICYSSSVSRERPFREHSNPLFFCFLLLFFVKPIGVGQCSLFCSLACSSFFSFSRERDFSASSTGTSSLRACLILRCSRDLQTKNAVTSHKKQ